MYDDVKINFLGSNMEYLFIQYVVADQLRRSYSSKMDEGLLKALVSALSRNYIIGLAALTGPEKDLRGNEMISIRHLGIDLSLYEDSVIKTIRDIRNNIIGHNNREIIAEGEGFLIKKNLLFENTKSLLDYLVIEFEKKTGRKINTEINRHKYSEEMERIFN